MELASHHLLVEAVVAVYAYVVEMGLRSFCDAHLKVDGVAGDIHLHGLDVREDIAVVVVPVAGSVVVFLQALVDVLLVVDVALLHFKHVVQVVGGDNGVSHPCDVADIVLVALVDLHKHVHVLLVVVGDGVFQDGGVAEAEFVVLVDHGLLGLAVALVGEFLRLEEVGELACLVDLAKGTLAEHRTLDLVVVDLFVADDDDLVDFHLGLLVDVHVEDHLVGLLRVVALGDGYLCILVALLVEVFLGEDLGAVDHVRCDLTASHDAQLGLHVLALRLLDADVVDAADAGAHAQMDAQVDLAAHEGVGGDAYLGEEAVAPIAFHCLCNRTAWDFYLLSDAQS